MGIKPRLVSNLGDFLSAEELALNRAMEMIGMQAEAVCEMFGGKKEEAYSKSELTRQGAVDTGRLRSSMTHEVTDSGTAVIVGTSTEYATYVEAGTSKMPARPYLRPAVQDHLEEYKRMIESQLRG